MLSFYSCSATPLILLAIVSLAWFVVGVLAGRALPAPGGASKPRKRGGKRGGGSRKAPASVKGNPELYVGNLSYDVTEKDLQRLLGDFGRVSSVRLITNSFNGKSKGYAFVQMGDRATSDKATKALNGKEYQGRKMVVNIAKNRAR
jgi:RNA recognition motif-containing protein